MQLSEQDNERMAKLYRQHILKEQVTEEPKLIQLNPGSLKKAKSQDASPAGFGD